MAAVWKAFKTNEQWKQYLQNLVKTNDRALYKAIVLIYDSQTEEEKAKEQSVEDNYIGFTKVDAKVLGDIAKKIKAGQQLTASELAKSRNKMAKYWKQLMAISKRQMVEREQAETAERIRIGKQYFKDSIEALRRCSEEGVACDYGICDECPVTQGLQMRLNLNLGGTCNANE